MALPKITKRNYYTSKIDKAYWSASQIKAFLDCPARAIAEINGEWKSEKPSTALLVGSYVDAAFEGKLPYFKKKHPECFNSRTGELKSEYKLANTMIKRAKSDPVFMEYMEGDKQKIVTGELFGLPFKAKYDVYCPDQHRIVDLKTTKDLQPKYRPGEGRLTVPEYWYWDVQMAIYAALDGNDYDTYLAVITKEDPADIELIEIDRATRSAIMEWLEEKMKRFQLMKEGIIPADRCCNCDYCRATKKLVKPITLEELAIEGISESED